MDYGCTGTRQTSREELNRKGQGFQGQQRRTLDSSGLMPRILIIDAVSERQFTTRGSDMYAYYVITGADFQELGPYIEDLQVVAELKDTTTNFRFKVKGQKSFLGQAWTDFSTDLLGEQTTAASPINGSAYSTRSELSGPLIQVLVGVRNAPGFSTLEPASCRSSSS